MKILVDLTFLGDGRITGIERFAIEIYKRLSNGLNIEYVCLLPAGYNDLNSNVENIHLPFSNKFVCHFLYPVYMLGIAADGLYLPAFPASPFVWIAALFRKNFSVYRVLHDVVPWIRTETIPWKAKYYFKPMEEYGLTRYKKVFTVSHYSAEKIKNILGVKVDNILYNGVASIFQDQEFSEGDRKLNLLSVGTIEPRKNYKFLVDLLGEILLYKPQAMLVICGRKGWGYDDLLSYVKSKSYQKNIKIRVDISDIELAQEYKQASIFLYSSLEEGFGIPLVEAMAKGIPVVASSGSAVTEVVADSGFLLESKDIREWTDTVNKLLDDSDVYEKYSSLSVTRSQVFTWESTVKTLEREFINEK
ncbi:glycosyltransferase family 1 protein [Oceanobacter sp. 5_MG-2023]|uniref:glycosyltransferase family 4 protein n=1 Tax=Oceanobacter sp. 5_MG-2023 TaxID=3062645 RepID=UPI0026E44511|nr:glycosyltransferase family 1 protein [Oceanobacter sp. 5_MG-2023]MDO6681325.1 glycosyltransferase family 1 protein [Oceanobacter sp. 5_MG-2023]